MAGGRVIQCKTVEEYYNAVEEAKDKLVVVDCFADWCGPCRAMTPVFEALSQQHSNVVFIKVNIDELPAVKEFLGVWALPTFVFVKRGQKVSTVTGANEQALRRGIENDGEVGMCSSCVIA
eukprot:Nitzschia sp. Nitz4//scaffold144_size56818//39094//39609//NITZ4_006543-RA/size56818-processed-gene-0.71-mRNA-1//1//CDS//3329536534//2459//frame0